MAESNIRFRVDARDALRQIREMSVASGRLAGSVAQASTKLGGLQGIIGRLAIAATTRSIVNQAAAYQQLELRVKLLSQRYGETAKLQAFAATTAKKFGMSSREALSGVTDLYARLRPMNIALEDIQTAFTGFNTVARLSGLSSAQAAGAFFQLSQALGSGRLQGDEFRSIAEQVPGLLTAVAKTTGIAQQKLKEYASQGKLTSDIIIESLRAAEEEGGSSLQALIEQSPVQKFKDFQNAVEELSISIGDKLVPAVTPLVKIITLAVKAVGALPDPIKAVIAGVMGLATAAAIAGPAIGLLITKIKAMTIALNTQNGALLVSKVLMAGPYVAAAAAVGVAIWGVYKALSSANNEHARYNKILDEGTVAAKENEIANLRAAIAIKERFIASRGAQKSGGVRKAEKDIEELRGKVKDLREAIWKKNGALKKSETNYEKVAKAASDYGKKLKELSDPINQLLSVTEVIGDSFKSSFKGLISGAMSAQQAMSNLFSSIADKFADMAAEMAATALKHAILQGVMSMFGGFSLPATGGTTGVHGNWMPSNPAFRGARSSGGPVAGGGAYLVGEEGPELFQPEQSGNIVSSNDLNSALAKYSPSASGPEAGGGGEAGENESGGTVGSRGSIDVSFTSEVINDVSYVTYAQFEEGVRQAAKQGAQMGEASVYKNLKNNPTTRRSVGV